ncbi:MAG: cell envelope integrity protein TolA [Proteobacteria bacterium]|nr:cell envelope integrity protein TolA [Pseudomonadota bacterium]
MAALGASIRPAFRFDVAPQSIKRVEQIGLPRNRNHFWLAFAGVVFMHLSVFIVKPDFFWSRPPMVLEESWDVNMEFLGEITQKIPQETALPNAQKSEEEAVPQNLLPQLPKKFQVEEQKPVEDPAIAEKKADEAVAELKKIEAKQALLVPKTEEDANKVDLDDLRKRLAVEKLKQENKVDERMKAQKDAIAKLKGEKATESAAENSGSSGGMVGVMRNNAFQNALKSAVSRNFNLPESFKYTQKKMSVRLTIVIGGKGELVSYKLNETSGNETYDLAALSALKNAVPLPTPPSEYVGKEIQFNF